MVEGHTDNIGRHVSEPESFVAPASLKAALVERGVAADRLNTLGTALPCRERRTPPSAGARETGASS
jgi:hypothetical protein